MVSKLYHEFDQSASKIWYNIERARETILLIPRKYNSYLCATLLQSVINKGIFPYAKILEKETTVNKKYMSS